MTVPYYYCMSHSIEGVYLAHEKCPAGRIMERVLSKEDLDPTHVT